MSPLFKSHYSIGKSILTLEPPRKANEAPDDSGASSILDIAIDNDLEEVYLVDDNMNGYLTAYNRFKETKIKLNFGLRLTFCEDMTEKNEASLLTNYKFVIFIRNTNGYKRLIKLASEAARDGFYYEPRYDLTKLKEIWSSEDLLLCIPFYDSFIYKNTLSFASLVPDFSFANAVFFMEDNDVSIDAIVKDAVYNYAEDRYPIFETKSIYYKNREDFKAWQSFKCIDKRTSLYMPNLEFCGSAEFCFEAWKEKQL